MTPEDIAKLEALAGLRLDADARELFARRLDRLLEYVRQIEAIDSEGADPLATTAEGVPELREDRVEASFSPERALSNAPEVHEGHFRIPSVMPPSEGEIE